MTPSPSVIAQFPFGWKTIPPPTFFPTIFFCWVQKNSREIISENIRELRTVNLQTVFISIFFSFTQNISVVKFVTFFFLSVGRGFGLFFLLGGWVGIFSFRHASLNLLRVTWRNNSSSNVNWYKKEKYIAYFFVYNVNFTLKFNLNFNRERRCLHKWRNWVVNWLDCLFYTAIAQFLQ